MTYDNATEADGRYQADRDRAAIWQATDEASLKAERLKAERLEVERLGRTERRQWDLLRLVGLR